MPSILLAESLSKHVNGAVKLTGSFKNLIEVINFLNHIYPSLYEALFNKQGEVNENVTFYLNSEPVTHLLSEAIPLHEKDCLEIVTTVEE